jgi:hypothetical protein
MAEDTVHDCDYYRNNNEAPESTTASRDWQLRFRALIEGARCSTLSHDERQRVVRYVGEFINLIYYQPNEYPAGLFEEQGRDIGDELDDQIAENVERHFREQADLESLRFEIISEGM